jgi:PAS domain S-box-containing protein
MESCNLDDLATLAEGLTHAIIALTTGSAIQFMNHVVEPVFGYVPAELRGESLMRIMPDRLQQRHRDRFQPYTETGDLTEARSSSTANTTTATKSRLIPRFISMNMTVRTSISASFGI